MKSRSIKTSTGIFALAIITQILLVLGTFSIHYLLDNSTEELKTIQDVEQEFYKALFMENSTSSPVAKQSKDTQGQYEKIRSLMTSPLVHMTEQLISQRSQIFSQLTELRAKSEDIHTQIQSMLPNLAESIQYIHAHHIAYLKNILATPPMDRKNHSDQGRFEKQDDIPAPETYIVEAVLQIHTSMQMIYDTFSKLKSGLSPAGISAEFNDRIKAFYYAINRFEDYSLDAQDGILIEELVINGRTFETSFMEFLEMETRLLALQKRFNDNKETFLAHINNEKQDKIKEHTFLDQLMKGLQLLSLGTSLFMFFLLIRFGWSFVAGFRRTLKETRRIRENIDYTIPISGRDFTELTVIFNALNSMSDTIRTQVAELKAAKTNLEQRVRRRTQELEQVNRQLKKEMKERMAGEQARINLEKRVFQSGKMESLGNLAGGIAHDFNNILTGILAYAMLAKRKIRTDPEKAESQVEMLEKSARRAADLVRRILTFTRSDTQEKISLDLADLTEEALKLIQSTIPSDIHLTWEIAPRATVLGDPTRLHQVVMNLCTNAAQAMEETGGTLSIHLFERTVSAAEMPTRPLPAGRYICITITDTGTGINLEDLDHIFEPYFTTKNAGDGTGLGLAIVYSIVREHKGDIRVTSEKGKGTVFSVLIPCAQTAVKPATEEPAPLPPATGTGHLMVVDDEAPIRKAFKEMLEDCGYRVSLFSNGAEALSAFQARPDDYDLLITDLTMPKMKGDRLIRRVLEIKSTLPVILCSGFMKKARQTKAFLHDNCCILQKPVDGSTLTAEIREMLDRAEAKD